MLFRSSFPWLTCPRLNAQSAIVCLALGLSGCGIGTVPSVEPPPPNMGQIVVLYMNYVGEHRGTGPHNEEEFKRFIRAQGADEARRSGVDLSQLDKLFISPRDAQPYVINYGLDQGDRSQGLQIIAHEAQGSDGKRVVAFMNGQIDEVNAERATELGLKSS